MLSAQRYIGRLCRDLQVSTQLRLSPRRLPFTSFTLPSARRAARIVSDLATDNINKHHFSSFGKAYIAEMHSSDKCIPSLYSPGESALVLLLFLWKHKLPSNDLMAVRSALLLENPQDILKQAVGMFYLKTHRQAKHTLRFLASRPDVLSSPRMRQDAIYGHGVFDIGNGKAGSDVARLEFLRRVDPNTREHGSYHCFPFAQEFVRHYIDCAVNFSSTLITNKRRVCNRDTDMQCLFSRSSVRLRMSTAWRIVRDVVEEMYVYYDLYRDMYWSRRHFARKVLSLLLQADYRLVRQHDDEANDESQDETEARNAAAESVKRVLVQAGETLATKTCTCCCAEMLQNVKLLSRMSIGREAMGDAVRAFASMRDGVLRNLEIRKHALDQLFHGSSYTHHKNSLQWEGTVESRLH